MSDTDTPQDEDIEQAGEAVTADDQADLGDQAVADDWADALDAAAQISNDEGASKAGLQSLQDTA